MSSPESGFVSHTTSSESCLDHSSSAGAQRLAEHLGRRSHRNSARKIPIADDRPRLPKCLSLKTSDSGSPGGPRFKAGWCLPIRRDKTPQALRAFSLLRQEGRQKSCQGGGGQAGKRQEITPAARDPTITGGAAPPPVSLMADKDRPTRVSEQTYRWWPEMLRRKGYWGFHSTDLVADFVASGRAQMKGCIEGTLAGWALCHGLSVT